MRLPTTCCLLLLLLAGTVAAQPPMGNMPPPGPGYGAPAMPAVYGQPNPNFPPPEDCPGPRPGFTPDPNQLTPCNTTYMEHSFCPSYNPCVECVEVPFTPSYVAVDFLYLKTHFSQQDLALNLKTPSGSTNIYFEQPGYEFAPRLTIRIQPWDEFGISGSWFQFQTFNRGLGAFNGSGANTITSAPFPYVPGTVTSTITGGAPFGLPSTVTVPFNNFVQSPARFYFLPLLPTVPINGSPATIGHFEYIGNAQAGFPDVLSFNTKFAFQTADLKFDRTWEVGDFRGTIGLGLQYLYFAHAYSASRVNAGGPLATNYDPFDSDRDLDSVDPASRFDNGPDYDFFDYGYHFTGVGPKIAFEATWPPKGPLQFYAKAGGAVALGGRKETLTINSVQNGAFHDHDGAEDFEDLAFSRTLNAHIVHNTFAAVPIAEAEAGVSYRFTDWYFKPFLQAAIIAQYYGGGGADLNPNATIFLYGVSATAGFEF
jgi:hypothetical protein